MIKKNFIQFALPLFIFVAFQSMYGCGGKYADKAIIPKPNPVCDAKADEVMKLKNYEKSIVLHEFFIKDNPDNGLAMYHLGFSYGQLGEHEKEIEYYEKAVELGYYGAGILFNLGMAYGEMDRLEDSVRIFNKAVDLNPDDIDALYFLGVLYADTGRMEQAEKMLKKITELDSGSEMVYDLNLRLKSVRKKSHQ